MQSEYKHSVIDIDGNKTDYTTEKPLSLKELQKLVDGYIEIMWTKDDRMMIVDEEYLYKKGPAQMNMEATLLANPRLYRGHPVFGPVVILQNYELD